MRNPQFLNRKEASKTRKTRVCRKECTDTYTTKVKRKFNAVLRRLCAVYYFMNAKNAL